MKGSRLFVLSALALWAVSAAARGETGSSTDAGDAAGAGAPAATLETEGPFDQSLELEGIRFRVTSPNDGPVSRLLIVPEGLEVDNSPIERTVDGKVTGAEVADLDADGSPELYVYVTSTDSAAGGSLVAYAANRRKSLSEIYLPPLGQNPSASRGYAGHDEFGVVENDLVRRFPLYDAGGDPTGRMRQIQYKLVAGEAGWILTVDRMVEF